jgi:hypothetical protein
MTPYNSESLLFGEFDIGQTPGRLMMGGSNDNIPYSITPGLFRTPYNANGTGEKGTDGRNNNNSHFYSSGNKLKRKEHLDSIRRNLDTSTLLGGAREERDNNIASTPRTYDSLNVLAESCIASAEKRGSTDSNEKDQLWLSLLSSANKLDMKSNSLDEEDADEEEGFIMNGVSKISGISQDDEEEDDEDDEDDYHDAEDGEEEMDGDDEEGEGGYEEEMKLVLPPKKSTKGLALSTQQNERNSSQSTSLSASAVLMMSPMGSTLSDINGSSFTPFLQCFGDLSGEVYPNSKTIGGVGGTSTKRKYQQFRNDKDGNEEGDDDTEERDEETTTISSFADRMEGVADVIRRTSSPISSSQQQQQSLSTR